MIMYVIMNYQQNFHIQSTYSLHDQVYEFDELMGIDAYMNKNMINQSINGHWGHCQFIIYPWN